MKINKNELSFCILVVSFLSFFGYYLYKFHYNIINSTAFSSFVTLLVGSIAIGLYLKQKSDSKEQAARVLLLEIRTAEERLNQMNEKVSSGLTDDLPSIFPSTSWKMYSHLFVGDFDQDELRLMTSFYDYGGLIDDFVKRNNDFFWITTEERARVVQQKLVDLVIHSKTQEEEVDLEALKHELLDVFANDTYSYTPKKTVEAIKNYLQKLNSVTTTSAGFKLKKLARMK